MTRSRTLAARAHGGPDGDPNTGSDVRLVGARQDILSNRASHGSLMFLQQSTCVSATL